MGNKVGNKWAIILATVPQFYSAYLSAFWSKSVSKNSLMGQISLIHNCCLTKNLSKETCLLKPKKVTKEIETNIGVVKIISLDFLTSLAWNLQIAGSPKKWRKKTRRINCNRKRLTKNISQVMLLQHLNVKWIAVDLINKCHQVVLCVYQGLKSLLLN